MLAMQISDDHVIALAALIPSTISAAVGWVAWKASKHSKVAADSVKPNGRGTMMEVGEKLLEGQDRTDSRLASLQRQQIAHEEHDDARFDELNRRVSQCESRHDVLRSP